MLASVKWNAAFKNVFMPYYAIYKMDKVQKRSKVAALRNCKGSTINTLYYYNQLKLIERDELAEHRTVHSSSPIRPMAIVNVRLAIRCVGPLAREVVRETH